MSSMKTTLLLFAIATFILGACTTKNTATTGKPEVNFDSLAITPPMGWNSYDCFGSAVNEMQVRNVTDYMAENLKEYGWQYIVVDIEWYLSFKKTPDDPVVQSVNLDQYGRFMPDTVLFPSSKGGQGFKVLAEYVHSKGLKFGVHLMRGISKEAVKRNTPIQGTGYFARDIADYIDTCSWSIFQCGIKMEKPGAQEYYNSVFRLFADWGVDFVKVDDIASPFHLDELEAIHKAIAETNRPIVLSLSPGPAPVGQLAQLSKYAHMWRITSDFWDNWKYLKQMFTYCHQWDSARIITPTTGHWPDADMLPIGKLRKNGSNKWLAAQLESTVEETSNAFSRFTDTEKYTLMTLWSIFKSPLMLGGYLPENDSVTYKLITNEEVIAVNQKCENNHEIRNSDGIVIWTADVPGSKTKYIALFNTNDGRPEKITVSWKEAGLEGELSVRDLWAKKDLGKSTGEFTASVGAHGCRLIRVSR